MTWNEYSQKYFDWLVRIVWTDSNPAGPKYHRFFAFLFNAPFIPAIPMDEPRVCDAIDLRYKWANEFRIGYDIVERYLYEPSGKCSMLEMMVALSVRMEEHIMADNELGDRTGQWFWDMVLSLGFVNMDDNQFNEGIAWTIVDRFNRRDYDANGHGGLFSVNNPNIDMRTFDIWYQMQHWITEHYMGGFLK